MTEPLHTSRTLIAKHALALVEWNHAKFVPGALSFLAASEPKLDVTPHILAIFEGGGMARFREESGRFRLLSTAQFEAGDRIEVNQHQVVMTKTRPEHRTHGNVHSTVWHIDRTNEMASGIILMKADGSLTQLVDWMMRDDVKAANEAVKIRKLVGAGGPPPPSTRSEEGFTL